MVKPDNCKNCGSEDLLFVKDNSVFNPELTEEDPLDILDTWVCNDCKTIHGFLSEVSFFDISINTNKEFTNKNLKNWSK